MAIDRGTRVATCTTRRYMDSPDGRCCQVWQGSARSHTHIHACPPCPCHPEREGPREEEIRQRDAERPVRPSSARHRCPPAKKATCGLSPSVARPGRRLLGWARAMRLGGRPGPPLAASSKMRLAVAPLFTFLPCTCPTSDLMDPHLATIFFNLLPSAARCPLPAASEAPGQSPSASPSPSPGWNQSRGSAHTGRWSLTGRRPSIYQHYHHPPCPPLSSVGRCHSWTTPSIHNTCPPALRSNGRRLLHTLLSICQFWFFFFLVRSGLSTLPSIHLDSIFLPLQGNQARPLLRAKFTIHLPLSSLTATLETCALGQFFHPPLPLPLPSPEA